MILITGDTHGNHDLDKMTMRQFPKQKDLTSDDYLIICGDFGCVWEGGKSDNYWLKWHDDKNYTTLFVDGNHENHTLLNQYDVEMWNGGKVHRIRPNVYHLMRGQVFEIEGKKIFTMGGANSTDKIHRKENVSWWAAEEISQEDMEEAYKNLEKVDYEVDYIITHTVSRIFKEYTYSRFMNNLRGESQTERYLDDIYNKVYYTYWFNGHWHIDENFLEEKQYSLYQNIVNPAEECKVWNLRY